MTSRSAPPRLGAAMPLRPANYAGIAAACASAAAAAVVRVRPSLKVAVGGVCLTMAFVFYVGVIAGAVGGWSAPRTGAAS